MQKGAGVIELSSDDEIPPDILQVIPHGAIDFTIGSTSQSSIMHLPPLGSSKSKGKAHANGSSHFEATANGTKKSTVASKKSADMKSQSTQVVAAGCIFFVCISISILAPNVGLKPRHDNQYYVGVLVTLWHYWPAAYFPS